MTSIDDHVERHRAVRRQLEESIRPLATSLDGRAFTFQASLHDLEVQAGGYVRLVDGERTRLGQVLTLELVQGRIAEIEMPAGDGPDGVGTRSEVSVRYAQGTGVLLDGDGSPFHDALVSRAPAEQVEAWRAAGRGTLAVGTLLSRPEVEARLDAKGFSRHSFLCGQSGSGKTYSLGVVLERLLLETTLPMVILDPNSDYVRLREPHPRASTRDAERWRGVADGITVLGPGRDNPIRLDVGALDDRILGALLRLDPVADAEEYEVLRTLLRGSERPKGLDEMERVGGDEGRRLVRRARNLGLDRWSVWAPPGERTLIDELRERTSRCLVVDLGRLGSHEEQILVSASVLAALWGDRARREPLLVVADEAHNVCPAAPPDAVSAIATDVAVSIAAEGRKFGLYLLLGTQRPNKVHDQVLSQCDNLMLMRMNSDGDVARLAEAFSFVPPGLLRLATGFRQGESLLAGAIARDPLLVRFGARVAAEGGADVPADWVTPG